ARNPDSGSRENRPQKGRRSPERRKCREQSASECGGCSKRMSCHGLRGGLSGQIRRFVYSDAVRCEVRPLTDHIRCCDGGRVSGRTIDMRAAVYLALSVLCSCAAFEPKAMGNEMGGTVMRDRGSTDEALLAAADSHCGQFSK